MLFSGAKVNKNFEIQNYGYIFYSKYLNYIVNRRRKRQTYDDLPLASILLGVVNVDTK